MRRFLLLPVLILSLSLAHFALAAGDVAHGQVLAKGCACHGKKFYGHDAQSLVEKLQAFKAGTGPKVMVKKMSGFSEQDIADVAAFFAAQPK
ncbi:MAG: cytochrome C [Desulfovibrionaceae bacterium]|jgi:cytochrome c553|nr:cytochrome C [Desulfovibrionaceae bacterium]